ncbi:unnamed protein product [Rotaria sp. Silwood2]|nr:unnamed protein product [Rotaria sp. Silwood2]
MLPHHRATEETEPNLSSIHCEIEKLDNCAICQNNSESLFIILQHILDNDDITTNIHIQVKNFSLDVILLNINNKIKTINLTCTIHSYDNGQNVLPNSPLNKKNLFGIIFLTTCVVLTLTLCTGWFVVISYRQYQRRRILTKLKKALIHSVQQILDKTPIIIFNSKNKNNDYIDDDPMCAICLESFTDSEKVRKLSCQIVFYVLFRHKIYRHFHMIMKIIVSYSKRK